MVTGVESSDLRPVLHESEEDGAVVIALFGDWDFAQAAALRERIGAMTARSIVIDLTRTTFLDSTIISVIVRTERRLSGQGYAASLRFPDDGLIKRMFAMMSLDRLFDESPMRRPI